MTRRQRRRTHRAVRAARRFRATAGWTLCGIPVHYQRSPEPKRERHRYLLKFVRLHPDGTSMSKRQRKPRHWPAIAGDPKPPTTQDIFNLFQKYSSPQTAE